MILVDAHEDLAWNIKTFGRDYTLPAAETRRREQGTLTPQRNGDTLLGWTEYQRGRVAVVFASLFAAPRHRAEADWDEQVYATTDQARSLYRGQVDTYTDLVESHLDHFRLIRSLEDLDETLEAWEKLGLPPPPVENALKENSGGAEEESGKDEGEPDQPVSGPAVGLVISMEGAEAVGHPGELEEWWELGVRIIGPAWAGTRFCGGTRQPGPLTKEGYALLEGMAGLGFGLDISHMDEQAALQALDVYPGTILASHSNVAALLKGLDTNRHLSPRLVQGLIERDGVIGIVPLNHFLVPGWKSGDGRQAVRLEHVVAHIDYVCQSAGDARHVGLGTDFDGGYGVQSVPAEVDTIADLWKIVPLLSQIGYTDQDIAAILGGNWIDRLRRILAEGG